MCLAVHLGDGTFREDKPLSRGSGLSPDAKPCGPPHRANGRRASAASRAELASALRWEHVAARRPVGLAPQRCFIPRDANRAAAGTGPRRRPAAPSAGRAAAAGAAASCRAGAEPRAARRRGAARRGGRLSVSRLARGGFVQVPLREPANRSPRRK